MAFSFEELKVYQQALKWVEQAELIHGRSGPKSFLHLKDQLIRAATSVALNIAEGDGKWSSLDKQNFFKTARGSLYECVAVIQVLHRRGIVRDSEYPEIYSQLESIGKMLTALIHSASRQAYMPKN